MPNPVAANDLQPISGSLQTSRVSYGVETAGKNYGQNYNSTTWYSDIPNNGQFYTIISDNYTANYYNSRSLAEGAYVEGGLPAVDEYSAPVFWVTPGTSSLDIITIVNGLPDRVGQVPFNSGSQALNWVASSSNYFAVGPDYYAQIDADNLRLYFEGNQIISYPTTGSTWYDLSGNGINGTLTNGPTWNSNGWFVFDGTDDLVEIPMIPLNDFTITQVLNMDNVDNQMPIGGGLYTNGADYRGYVWFFRGVNQVRVKVDGETGPDFGVNVSVWADKWISYTATRTGDTYKLYINGQQVDTTRIGSTNQFSVRTIGWGYSNAYAMQGDLANTLIYPRELSATEVAQNYYGGPIVTDGLVFAIDAGNLVSYPKSGTTAYSLTGSDTATLANGTGFSSEAGGTWVFDGTNDQMNGPTSVNWFTNTSFSIEVWIEPSTTPTTQVYFAGVGPVGGLNKNLHLRIYDTGQLRMGFLSDDLNSATGIVDFGEWNHIVMQYNYATDTSEIFHNGGRVASGANGPFNDSSARISIGYWYGSGQYTSGNIASVRVYSKALTADEVLQNYNATK